MKSATAILVFAVIGSLLTCELALGQPYPAKPVRFMVGFPPGGGNDVVARIVAAKLGEFWNQTIVIDNRPGATGTLAANLVARAPADGYTFLAGAVSTNAIAPSIYSNLPYDFEKAFAPVTLLASIPHLISVHPSLPVNTLKQLASLAKANPGKIAFPSAGSGSTVHIAGEIFMLLSSTKMLHVPYKGAAQALPDLLSGQTSVSFDTTATLIQHVKTGRVRALAITANKRFPLIQTVATTAEAGFPGFEMATWIGLFAPADTPRTIVEKVHGDIAKILRQDDVKEKLITNIGADESVTHSPEEFRVLFRNDIARYAKIVKAAGIRLD